MDERQDTPRKQLDLRSETGISRRDLLRRGAIVGGTLVWVAPAIQTFGSTAYAASPLCTVCLGTATEHVSFNPTTTCCDCVATNGGGLAAILICSGNGSCTPGPVQSGPC